MPLDEVYSLSPVASFQSVGDGAVVLLADSGQLYSCNDTSEAFLRHVDGKRTLGDIVDLMAEEYEVERALVAEQLADEIQRNRQLELSADGAGRPLEHGQVGVGQGACGLDDIDRELQPVELVTAGGMDDGGHQQRGRRGRIAVSGAHQVGMGIGNQPSERCIMHEIAVQLDEDVRIVGAAPFVFLVAVGLVPDLPGQCDEAERRKSRIGARQVFGGGEKVDVRERPVGRNLVEPLGEDRSLDDRDRYAGIGESAGDASAVMAQEQRLPRHDGNRVSGALHLRLQGFAEVGRARHRPELAPDDRQHAMQACDREHPESRLFAGPVPRICFLFRIGKAGEEKLLALRQWCVALFVQCPPPFLQDYADAGSRS